MRIFKSWFIQWILQLTAFCGLVLSCSCTKTQETAGNNFDLPQRARVNRPIAVIPAEILLGGGILVKISVNDSDPLWFALDSGGGEGFIIDSGRAKALNLDLQGETRSIGEGENPIKVAFVKNVSIKLPANDSNNDTIGFPNQTAAVIALNSLEPFSGHKLDGIIGDGLFIRYVVEIDFAERKVNLYEPQNYQYSGEGAHFPLMLEKHNFYIQAKVTMPGQAPHEAKLMIDTGAPMTTVTFNRPFVEKYGLLKGARKQIPDRSFPGLGGETKQLLERADKLQLGDLQIDQPTVSFSQDAAGSLASFDFDGILGGELLRRFKVIFDVPHKQLFLEPNKSFAEPYEHNMSGIGLITEGEDFKNIRIYRIIEDSPAARAGLQENDRITTIDGKPAGDFTIDQLYRLFKQEGRSCLLGIERNGKAMRFTIKLKRLI